MKIRFSLLVCVLSAAFTANAGNVFINPGFETGDFTGWTVTTSLAFPGLGYSAGWYVDSTPNDATPSGAATVGPSLGQFYAVSDDQGPATVALTQSFTVPVGTTDVVLSFDIFVNDYNQGMGGGPSGTGGEVDLLPAGSDPITGTGVVLWGPNDFAAAQGSPNPYELFGADITADVVAGQTYILRVLNSDDAGTINTGVDNFDLEFPNASTPEPAMFLPLSMAAGYLFYRRRKALACN